MQPEFGGSAAVENWAAALAGVKQPKGKRGWCVSPDPLEQGKLDDRTPPPRAHTNPYHNKLLRHPTRGPLPRPE